MARISLAATFLVLFGCLYVPPVWDIGDEIYGLDSIEPGVTTKEQVLGRLGEPGRSYELAVESRFIYAGHKSGGAIVGLKGGGEIGPVDWMVVIVFDENDVVTQVSTAEVEDPRFTKAMLKAKAKAGDPEAQYEFSFRVRRAAEVYRWLCLAASWGVAEASARLGNIHRYGAPDLRPNFARSYKWWKLAEQQGHSDAPISRSEAAKFLSPDQMAEAEHVAAGWRPADCSAELKQVKEEQVVGEIDKLADLGAGATWHSLCREAVFGVASAQYVVASYYELGRYPIKRDLARAYAWYKLAASNGYTSEVFYSDEGLTLEKSEDIAHKMTAAQQVEAQRLILQWTPELADCFVLLHPTDEITQSPSPARNERRL